MVDDPNKTESGSFIEDEDFLAADSPVQDAVPEKRNLKEIWDTTPSLQVFAVVAGLALLVIGFMIFGGGSKPTEEENSAIKPGASVSQPPGTAELPPAYEEAVRQANEQSAKQAAAQGTSSIPTPIARPSERIEAPVQVQDTDPLSEWRREAEARRIERQQQEDAAAVQNAAPPPALPSYNNVQNGNGNSNAANTQQAPLPTAPTAEQVNTMAQQLQQFISQNVMEPQTPKESVVVSLNVQPAYDITKYFPKKENGANGNGANANSNGAISNAVANPQKKPKPIIDAGTIAYAQILTEANSDVPGPVLAEVASGPLSGGRAIGQFQVAEDHLVVTFSRVVKDGVEYTTTAYALDPETTLPGMATDVNNHYFQRVFLPAAARFIQGFADAASQTQTSVVVSDGTVVSNSQNDLDTRQEILKGVDEGAQKVGDIMQTNAERPITVKIHAGTRIGLLFVNAVQDPNLLSQMNNGGQQQGLGQTILSASPYGQVYNAYNAYMANSASQQPNAATPVNYASQQQGSQTQQPLTGSQGLQGVYFTGRH